ncbi:sugar transferase [Streptomyces sp. NPDC101118]|uniref:sugar transferase n=1 Tax=Streptomyces sp. NPDC101118 TaxID=3366109 RepID=UPI0037F5FE6C
MPALPLPPLPASLPRPRPGTAKRGTDLFGAALALALAALPLLAVAAALALTTRRSPLVREEVTGRGGTRYHRHLFRGAPWVTRYALDGLPQLFDVLRGEMSLVGPRPLPPGDGIPRERALVRPGMTGLWQVSARSDLPWEEMALLDLHYVEHHWLGMDLAILAQTPRAALRARRPAAAAPRAEVRAA